MTIANVASVLRIDSRSSLSVPTNAATSSGVIRSMGVSPNTGTIRPRLTVCVVAVLAVTSIREARHCIRDGRECGRTGHLRVAGHAIDSCP